MNPNQLASQLECPQTVQYGMKHLAPDWFDGYK